MPYNKVHTNDLEINRLDCIWIEIILNKKHILLGTFYRPPNSDSTYYAMIEDSINLAVDTGITDIVIFGDFNYNMLSDQTSRKIMSMCLQFGLEQTITNQTHFTENSSSLIDLLMVSNKNNLITSGVADPFLDQQVRYHCPIYGIFKFRKPISKSFTKTFFSYDKGDFNTMRDKASNINWEMLIHNDIDVYANNITNKILDLTNSCIPNKTARIRPYEPPWMNNKLRLQIRVRKRAYRKAKQIKSDFHWNRFRQLRNKTILDIRAAKQSHLDSLAKQLSSKSLSSKDWWKTLKSFIKPHNNSSLPPFNNNGSIITDQEEKANLLNNLFQSQTFINDNNIDPPIFLINAPVRFNIIPSDVKQILKLLPSGKATGPDNIINRVLRELSSELSTPLCKLFNKVLLLGIFPESWKEANVCAIFKKGDPSQVNNYRPISLLSCIDKVFERLIFKYVFNHFKDNDILSAFQSGFKPGDSSINQLTYLYNSFCKAIDAGKEIRVVFFDISKAFDRVWHKGLLAKLNATGLPKDLVKLVGNYLSDRRQRVVVPGTKSSLKYICAGVPQGSILGPLLFLLYVNDIVSSIQSNIRLFADDTSLFLIIDRDSDVVSSANTLNQDILTVMEWAER